MIRIVGKRGKGSFESQLDEAAKGKEFVVVDCTSENKDEVMHKGLSPFYLGPVETYDGLKSETFELSWQCAKVYPNDVIPGCVDYRNDPAQGYFSWRDKMWAKRFPEDFTDKSDIRFPAGRGNAKKCLYSWWKVNGEYKKLGYVEARKQIYMPLYAKCVVKTEAYRRLCSLRDEGKNLMLVDFDGYNIYHPKYSFTYNDALNCPCLKMGHGFVLAMLLEGLIKVDEAGNVSYAEGLMDESTRSYDGEALRSLSDEAKLERNAAACCVTEEEYRVLSETQRKRLRLAAQGKKDNFKPTSHYALGISKAEWERLPLADKLARIGMQGESRNSIGGRTESVVTKVESRAAERTERLATGDRMPCPEGFTNAVDFAGSTGVIENWKCAENAGIVRLWIPQEITSIGNFAFKGCPNLEEVVCEDCGGGAALAFELMSFAGCAKLKKVSLPVRVDSIGKGAFRDNPALIEFAIAAGHYPVTCADHAFDNCPDSDAKLMMLKA